ncbi:hypothetical protein DY218_29510 [Streptomyces triticagri]|uniref:Zinc finger CGNR domain-containing protein n=1 Tax=Streptomyces triticagri TaxID=2293568 RepID=A0A372LWT5_9ACTN|nr:ABATE domain-containing protein [Streptomyces triticagri]RFU83126.1 hypothetical protein DY218_29510 [Streptomyces triticagri]
MKFSYVSGNPALDLTGTVECRREAASDLLTCPGDLEQWVGACEELPSGVSADAAALDHARRLREALHRLAVDRVQGRAFTQADLQFVNAAATGAVPTVELADEGLLFRGDIRSALTQVARSGITLLGDRSARIKECGGTDCTRLYVDRSRGGRRTWCGMETCGNRVKAAAYRARRHSAVQD